MHHPFISVLVPVYNVEDCLQECLDSLRRQTYPNFEIVAVDDGSTDGSGDILRRNAEEDFRIRIISQDNKGLAGARNTAIRCANGDAIAFVDSDDFVDDDYLQKMVDTMVENGCDVVAFGGYIYTDKECRHQERPGFSGRVLSGREAVRALNSYTSFSMSMWGKLIEKSLFDGVVFPEGKNSEDQFVCFKLLLKAKSVLYVDDPIYYYRQRKGSISRGSKVNTWPIEASEEQYDLLKGEGPDLEKAAATSCYFSSVAVFNAYAVRGRDVPSDVAVRIEKNTKAHFSSTMANRDIPRYKKAQAVLFRVSKSAYKFIYLRRRG